MAELDAAKLDGTGLGVSAATRRGPTAAPAGMKDVVSREGSR